MEGLSQGILHLEKGTTAPEVVARMLRFTHTLKGAARVVRQPGIAELAHTAEGILTTHRDGGLPLSRDQGSELLDLLDGITARLSAINPAIESVVEPARQTTDGPLVAGAVLPLAEDPLETLRVEIGEMDMLLRTVSLVAVQLGAVRKGLGATDRTFDLTRLLVETLTARDAENGAGASVGTARARSLAEELRSSLDHFQRSLNVDLDRVEAELAGMRDLAYRLRLIPAQTLFPSLERSVRDAAQTLGKRVVFEASGGEVRLDASVLASVRDALMHIVRNAVAHGLETEAERVALGKSPVGQVRMEVLRRGGRVAFVCSDDGRGIDVEAVRRAAVARGLLAASEARSLPADKVFALLRAGGLSTSNGVTELSGRGIGLDVVRETMSRLKGEMSIRSEAGRGAAIEVRVPVSIASLQSLVVEAAGVLAAIPLDAVSQTLRVSESDIVVSAESDSILHGGAVIPFFPLERILRGSGRGSDRTGGHCSVWSAVVVRAGVRSVAVGVDKLLGTANIVMRSLPGVVEADAVILGASLDAEGNPQFVLDPAGLVAAAERGRDVTAGETQPRRAPVLVIDDSMTTRMLEQSILESAGYEVELAVSAEDALTKARDRPYSLFITDVEMPGMSGFEFVARTRAEAALRDIPAILVTSRNAVEDRQRGRDVGARGYIVKSEFDQGHLLQIIRTLIG